MGTHAGTHVDAPCHLAGLAGGVESLALAALIGPALVVQASPGGVRPADVAELRRAHRSVRRVLFRGGSMVTPAAARALARAGFLLVGTDGLSIDPVEDATLPAHVVLLEAGVVVLESLDLTHASPGSYDLIALPLLLPGCDGAPARAILMAPGSIRKGKAGTAIRRRRPT